MTESIDTLAARLAEGGYLDRPQRLGVLPTREFWDDRANAAIVSIPLILGASALGVAAEVVASELIGVDRTWGVPIVLAIASYYIGLGLIERYIRRRAKAIRAATDSAPA